MPAPFGDGKYAVEPPQGGGLNITDLFHIVKEKPDDPGIKSKIDSQYPNVAIITFDDTNQFGGMWAKEQLDLSMAFSTEIYLHLGHQYNGSKADVADGMTFTLHNDPAGLDAIGGAGEGLGVYKGRKWTGTGQYTTEHGTYLRHSLVIEFDTYRNTFAQQAFVDDPANTVAGTAHCAVITPALDSISVNDHKNTFNFKPVQDWVKFAAAWIPDGSGGGTINYSFDGTEKSYKVDDMIKTFGDTKVYWGFTGATGGQSAVQAAAITRMPEQGVIAEKTVKNSAGKDINHGGALAGESVDYTIRVTARTLSDPIGPIVINDEISGYLEVEYGIENIRITTSAGASFFVGSTYSGTMNVNTTQYLTNVGDWIEITFRAKIKDDATGQIVYNHAIVRANGLSEDRETNYTDVTVFAVPQKKVSDTSAAGKNGATVKVGDLITYDISYSNEGTAPATIVITDKLHAGVDWVASPNGSYDEATHTVTWTIQNVQGGSGGTVTVEVRVNKIAVARIANSAVVKVGDNEPQTTNFVINPIKGSCTGTKQTIKCRKIIKGRKIWVDDENAGKTRPAAVEIVLLRDEKVYKSVSVISTSDGAYVFGCLPIRQNSEHEYVYRVDEPAVPKGYTKRIDGYNVTNTLG